MFKLIIVSSGSKSNAAIIRSDSGALLVDCGVSLRTLKAALDKLGILQTELKAAVITHSHSDHTKGIATVKKNLGIPFYSAVKVEGCTHFEGSLTVGDITVEPFACSHDVDCVGYKISYGGRSVCIATDTGVVTDDTLNALMGVSTVVLESNHDVDMLRSGPYPLSLKHRILSCDGHLSNADCAKTLAHLASCGLRCAVLAHISEHNNTPLMARACAVGELDKYGFDEVEVIPASDMLEIDIQENCNENSNSR